ncbi:Hypothetical predicted protein [Paramuricea clavata]|uniref:Uncharacterized protein n=1 Tax=Paramuricea clavata TaxID=317549 RepID=A0A7D9DKF5_PARCT|nr:Hypothetical predicted protein [Paramuricea clavata]
MTSLFVKLTNQIISTCKAYINKGGSRIWDSPKIWVYRVDMQVSWHDRNLSDECQRLNTVIKIARSKIAQSLSDSFPQNKKQAERDSIRVKDSLNSVRTIYLASLMHFVSDLRNSTTC